MADEAKPVVLVADDEPSTLALVSSHLRAQGYTVLEATDGDQAWELATEHLPNLVVLDVMMPGMSGWEVCRSVREAVSLAHTGVVMLTGIGENLNEMTSPLYGADAYVDKPFEFSELDRQIRGVLARRRGGALGRPDAKVFGETAAAPEETRAPRRRERAKAAAPEAPAPRARKRSKATAASMPKPKAAGMPKPKAAGAPKPNQSSASAPQARAAKRTRKASGKVAAAGSGSAARRGKAKAKKASAKSRRGTSAKAATKRVAVARGAARRPARARPAQRKRSRKTSRVASRKRSVTTKVEKRAAAKLPARRAGKRGSGRRR